MKYLEYINCRIIQMNDSIHQALKIMDIINKKLLLVFDNNKFKGVLSIGDIQKAIISNISLDTAIKKILRKDFVFAKTNDSKPEVLELMKKHRIECMPVKNAKGELEDVYLWEELFGEKIKVSNSSFNLPIVIMAGGLGTRLKPLTNVLPKPLIPIGERTIIEEIFEQFNNYGCNDFYISVNYKAELIEYYLKNQNLPYKLHYFKERKPLGTAGSLSILKGFIKETFFVSNCDIIIEQDVSEILEYHKKYSNEITIVAALKHFPLAYGIIETGEDGQLLALKEKPELTFKINSGMYILEPHLLNEIPDNKMFHITELIEKVKKRNGKVGVFPVSEKSWRDFGSWAEYMKLT